VEARRASQNRNPPPEGSHLVMDGGVGVRQSRLSGSAGETVGTVGARWERQQRTSGESGETDGRVGRDKTGETVGRDSREQRERQMELSGV